MSELTVYTYGKCSTCRAAIQWLQRRGIPYVEKPIREAPPGLAELKAMLAAQPGGLRRLFNTSGLQYRALGLAAKLPSLSVDDALHLLAGNGLLIKRPFLLGPGVALVGFDPKAWAQALTRPQKTGKAERLNP